MNNSIFVVSGSKTTPNREPAPSSSRNIPSTVSAMVNPMPIPTPSKKLGTAPFLHAKASARPSIIQFTTIKGMYIPNDLFIEGRYACRHICNIVTKDAIITTNTGMRTLSGVRFLTSDMTTLEHINTNIVANPIDIPLTADVVVASVGHIPSRRTNVGFSCTMPFITILR